jgi:hypothetical protein
VVFESPHALGVDPGLLCLGSLRCGFLLEFCETPFVLENPLGIFELKLKQFPFPLAIPASPKRIRKFSLLLKTLGFAFTSLLSVKVLEQVIGT